MGLTQDQDVVQALPAHAPEEALARGVGAWCPERRAQHGDPAGSRDAGEGRPVLAVVVADQEPGPLVEGRRLAQLLRHPGIRGVAGHAHMHHSTRAERDDNEREERAEPQVDDREEIALCWPVTLSGAKSWIPERRATSNHAG